MTEEKVLQLDEFRATSSRDISREFEKIGQATQMTVSRVSKRIWLYYLKPHQFYVLSLLVDQTIGLAKRTRKFTYQQLAKGTNSNLGTGLSRSALKKTIKQLEELGAIVLSGDRTRELKVTVNLNWKVSLPPADKYPDRNWYKEQVIQLREEAHERKCVDDPTPGSQTTSPSGHGRPPFIEEYLEGVDKGNNNSISSDDECEGRENPAEQDTSPEETISVPLGSVRKRKRPSAQNFETGFTDPTIAEVSTPVRKRSRPTAEELAAHREEKRAENRTRTNPGAVLKTFDEAFEQFFSEIEGMRRRKLTHLEMGKLKGALCKDWADDPEALHEFVEFSVANWTQIVHEHLGWMTQSKPPIAPDILFLNWRRGDFREAWNLRHRENWLDKVPNADRRRYHTLTKVHGMSSQEAILKVAKEKSDRETREEVDAKLNEAKRHHATAHGLVKRREREEQVLGAVSEKSPNAKRIAQLEEENKRLREQVSDKNKNETLQPGSNFELPEWDDDK